MHSKAPLLQSAALCPSEGLDAGIAQLVEHKLPKLGVAGSSPVARSTHSTSSGRPIGLPEFFLAAATRRRPGACEAG